MSLQPQPPHVVPPDTTRVARAIYPKGNLYMQVFDALGGELFTQAQFTEFYQKRGVITTLDLTRLCILHKSGATSLTLSHTQPAQPSVKSSVES